MEVMSDETISNSVLLGVDGDIGLRDRRQHLGLLHGGLRRIHCKALCSLKALIKTHNRNSLLLLRQPRQILWCCRCANFITAFCNSFVIISYPAHLKRPKGRIFSKNLQILRFFRFRILLRSLRLARRLLVDIKLFRIRLLFDQDIGQRAAANHHAQRRHQLAHADTG